MSNNSKNILQIVLKITAVKKVYVSYFPYRVKIFQVENQPLKLEVVWRTTSGNCSKCQRIKFMQFIIKWHCLEMFLGIVSNKCLII